MSKTTRMTRQKSKVFK